MGDGGPPVWHHPSVGHNLVLIRRELLTLPFQPVLGAAKIVAHFTQSDGEPAVMTWGAKHNTTDPWSVADLSALATAVYGWFAAGDGTHNYLNTVMANDCTMDSIECRDLTVDGSTIAVFGTALVGGLSGGPLPNGISFALTAASGLTGRSNRGRSFLACLAKSFQSSSDANQADASKVTNIVAAFNALPAAVAGASVSVPCHLAVISRFHAKVRLAAGVTVPIVSYHAHDTALDFQRRRAPSHNRHG